MKIGIVVLVLIGIMVAAVVMIGGGRGTRWEERNRRNGKWEK